MYCREINFLKIECSGLGIYKYGGKDVYYLYNLSWIVEFIDYIFVFREILVKYY